MSEIGGTKLPIQNVRSPVANGGKADNICSLRDLPVLTHLCHSTINFAVMHNAHSYNDVVGYEPRGRGSL
jgi:hypothetical protein